MDGTTILRGLLLIVLLVAVVPGSTTATDYTVGDSSGWTTGVDYSAWTRGKTFHVGDTLSFHYATGHSVMEVSAADHSACSTSNPLRSHTGQSATIQLTSPGTRYFICGTTGHCAGGMKLAVTVSSSRSSAGHATTTTSSSTMLSAKPSKPATGDEQAQTSGSGATRVSAADDTTAAPGSSSKLISNTSGAAGSAARVSTTVGLILVAVGLSCLV